MLGGTLGEAQGAVPGKKRTLYAWPDLHRALPTPSFRKTIWSPILGGTRGQAQGAIPRKTPHFTHGQTYAGCFPFQAVEEIYCRRV